MKILCVNAGSSSLKYKLFDMPEEKVLVSGSMEKIGSKESFWNTNINGEKTKGTTHFENHKEAVHFLKDELINNNVVKALDEIKGVGHRVLHGGEKYSNSVIITDQVIDDIRELTKLGPLHHPGNLAGIESLREELPNTPMVAVYDTSFHHTIPKRFYLYPVPYEWYEKYGVRKYGFHGISHNYITNYMQDKLNKHDVNLIICHIGNGASITAIKDGVSYATSMGLTPLDGLMMGTRCGKIDPSILEYVAKESGKDIATITNELNKKSGFLGICGHHDCRDVEMCALDGDEKAILALQMYADRIVKYIVDYYIKLEGKVEEIVFTAGVGENSVEIRKSVINKLKPLGIYLDEKKNAEIGSRGNKKGGIISSDESKIEVSVVPTNEELMIARDTYNLVK